MCNKKENCKCPEGKEFLHCGCECHKQAFGGDTGTDADFGMQSKEFTISGKHIENLPSIKIEANNIEEAVEKYQQMWDSGDIPCHNSELIAKIEDNPDENQYVKIARKNWYRDYFTFSDNHIETVMNWHRDDIKQQAKNDKVNDLTEEEIDCILWCLYHDHDANEGINWTVISCQIDKVISERNKK